MHSMTGIPSAPSTLRALVVDDDPVMRLLATRLLPRLGIHRIELAENGLQAMQAIEASRETFDVVLCDLNMPKTDGVVLLREFAARNVRVPVILMSGEDPLTLDAAERLGTQQGLRIHGTLAKPFSFARLADLVSSLDQQTATSEPALSNQVDAEENRGRSR